jgi:YHS domain-containing protein
VAKEDMICPFSGELCRECPVYRGRHYYLCFSKKYRGLLEKPGGYTRESSSGTSEAEYIRQFEIPSEMPSAIDPFTVPMSDVRK